MPTIYDIPKQLINPNKKADFIGWVKRLPSETWVKRELSHIWSLATKVDLDHTDYFHMGL
jgi:hypothetical protein